MSSSGSNSSTPPTNSQPGQGQGQFTEYKLKTSPMAVLHNVMVLHSSTAKLSDFTPPIRMIRDKKSSLLGDADNNNSTANASAPGPVAGKAPAGGASITKRKSRLIFQGDQPGGLQDDPLDPHSFHSTESIPWLLEDFDAQHSFLGRLEGGQSSNYVFFVNQGDEFRIIPVSKWYRFGPKLSYHTFTLEEAEQEMAAKGDIDRWLMKTQKNKQPGSSPASSTPSSPKQPLQQPSQKRARLVERLGHEAQSRQQQQQRLAHLARNQPESREDLDFDEVFDDDDGDEALFGPDDEAAPTSPLKKSTSYKLSTEGRQMKRIVRQLDKNNDIIYASDDEMDPYASDEEEEDYSTANNTPPTAKTADEGNFDKLVDPVTTTTTATSSNKSRSTTPAASRATSPAGSPHKLGVTSSSSSSANKKAKPSPPQPQPEDDSITEAMLVGFLRQGPLSTKDLIAKFKRQLKADPRNKEIFRELVRRVAMVKAAAGGMTGEEDKLLELKPEYK